MKTSGRTEWIGLPGYLAAARISGEERAVWNSLGLFDADTLEEFLRDPVTAIERSIWEEGKESPKNAVFAQRSAFSDEREQKLLTLVMKFATVAVMAERERVREDEEHNERRARAEDRAD